jgi:hypothetical protein
MSFLETEVTIFQIQWGTIELHISMYVSSLIIISPTSCERIMHVVVMDCFKFALIIWGADKKGWDNQVTYMILLYRCIIHTH